MENTMEKIMEVLNDLDAASLVRMWDDFCEADSRMDDYIYLMEEFDEIMSGQSPWEVARACFYGHEFCPAHDYFWYNGYGNLESADYPAYEDHCPICNEEIANYIINHDEDFDNDDIREILDQAQEEEEEEEEEEENE